MLHVQTRFASMKAHAFKTIFFFLNRKKMKNEIKILVSDLPLIYVNKK